MEQLQLQRTASKGIVVDCRKVGSWVGCMLAFSEEHSGLALWALAWVPVEDCKLAF